MPLLCNLACHPLRYHQSRHQTEAIYRVAPVTTSGVCSPKGSALLYARPEVQHLLEPLVVSWGWNRDQTGPVSETGPVCCRFEKVAPLTEMSILYVVIPAASATTWTVLSGPSNRVQGLIS